MKCCNILIKIEIKMIGNNIVRKNGILFLFVRLLNMKFILLVVYLSSLVNKLEMILISMRLIFVFNSK